MTKGLRKNLIIVAIVVVVFVIIGSLVYLNEKRKSNNPALIDFAKCLSDKGVKMYGAYWCPHCNNQKKMFGDAWKDFYIECALPSGNGQTQACQDAGINGYPTWVFQDGKKVEGELSFEELSQYSGCELKK
jgi:hypothetical protein